MAAQKDKASQNTWNKQNARGRLTCPILLQNHSNKNVIVLAQMSTELSGIESGT